MARTFCLRVYLDSKYPEVIQRCANAIASVRPNGKVGYQRHGAGCTIVRSYWSEWPQLFPQHGPGRKHTRKIELAEWQEEVVTRHPAEFLRGCLESDGCRSRRIVKGRNYPFYEFANESNDIRAIFEGVCGELGLQFTRPVGNKVAITRRADVAKIDEWFAYSGGDISARSFKGLNPSIC